MPILEKYTAMQFHGSTARGMTKPFRVTAKHCETGEEALLVVKPRAGYGNRQDAIYKEILSTLLARELGLYTPTPVIVDLSAGLAFAAADDEQAAEMIRTSVGLNFATIDLGNDWKTWTVGANPQNMDSGMIEDIYAFDALVQNTDRRPDNPNLLWKGEQIAALDFDRSLAYLSEAGSKPWSTFLAMMQVTGHALYKNLKIEATRNVGLNIWDNYEGWRYPGGSIDSLVEGDAALPPLNCSEDSYLPSVVNYLYSLPVRP